MNEPKRITVEVTEKQHREVRVKAALDCLSISDAVRRLIEMWLTGDVVLSKPPPEETQK